MKTSNVNLKHRKRSKLGRAVRHLLLLILAATMLNLGAEPLAAASSVQRPLELSKVELVIKGDPAITISALDIEGNLGGKVSHLIGQVVITRGQETITADRAVWHEATNTAELSGNIVISAPDFTILADRAVINMDVYTAKVYDGRAHFPAQNYYLSGAVIERIGEKTFRIEEGTATTCDGPNPAWTIEARRLTVTEGGYATASGASLNTKHFPVMSMPFFLFPVKNERQSGLLTPYLASSSRDGLTASLPLFWATGENHDLTYIPVWREKRGLASTLEGRYHLTSGKGIWQATYLDDRKGDHFEYKNSNQEYEANQRYWIRAKNGWRLADWDVNLDVDLVSDPLFLSTFRNDVDGFYKSSNLFSQEFGRTVDEYLDPVRVNTLYAQKTNYDSSIRGTLTYKEDLYSQDNRETLQQLPSLQYNLVSHALGADSPDYGVNRPRLSLDMRYDYFYRTFDQTSPTDERGQRVVMKPTLEWSTPVADVATLDLSGDVGLNMYGTQGHQFTTQRPLDENGLPHDNRANSIHGSYTAKLSTTMGRIYEGGFGQALATRHQITPTVYFTQTKADDQEELPYFDFRDRQLSRRTLRYGFLNTFVTKTEVVSEDNKQSGYDYFQLLKVGLWSSYEFADNHEWANNAEARYLTADYYDRGAGPLEIDVEAFFNPNFSLRSITGVDGRTGEVVSHDISFRAQDNRGDSLTMTYDFDSPSTAFNKLDFSKYEEVRADLSLIFTDEWSGDLSSRYDVQNGRSLETNARLMYQAQCYKIGLLFSDSENDKRLGLMVDLLGLGSFNGDYNHLASAPTMFYY